MSKQPTKNLPRPTQDHKQESHRGSARGYLPENSRRTKLQENHEDGSLIYEARSSVLSQLTRHEQPHESLTHDQVNKWSRYSSRLIDEKIIELSGVCEQIPQLEVFSRTLQFSHLESTQKVAFFRVVEVMISLHHRVSYLSRKKPQLLKELENASSQLNFINRRIQTFLAQMNEQTQQILPVNFGGLDERWKSQLMEDFTQLQGYLCRLSEIIISQDMFHTENYRKIQRFLKIAEMFTKVMAGEQEFVEEWMELINSLHQDKDSQAFANDQCKLLILLDQCLSLERSKISTMRPTGNDQSNRTNEELEVEVNKLIEDYERVKRDNSQLANNLQLEQRLKEQLLIEVDERDKIIKNLSAKKLHLEKKLANQEGHSNTSSRIKDDGLKKLEHDAQKYLESSLLLKEQLKVSESEREKLIQIIQTEKTQYLKIYQNVGRLKPEKERLEIECQQLRNRIETQKNESLRHTNRLTKMVTDLQNDKSLLQMQVDTAERNNLRLMERLDLNQKKLSEYNKLMMNRLDEREESSFPKDRDAERLKKQLTEAQGSIRDLEHQNQSLREEVNALKSKLKEHEFSKEDQSERQQLISEYKNRLEKLQTKNQVVTISLQDAKSHEEELEERLKHNAKRMKQFEGKERDLETEKNRLTNLVEEGDRKAQDLQRQLQEMRHWAERQTRTVRQTASKKELQWLQKTSTIGSLQIKIRMLEQQLTHKAQQSQRASQDLVETRMKQYESTIETHKLIQLKMEEQTRLLKKDLDQKLENEVKLTSEVDRLAKEIDRMKSELEKYLRELTEKEIVIKMERERSNEQLKQLREYEVREKVRKEQMNTPHHDKPNNEDDTPSQLEQSKTEGFVDPLGRSNLRYDNYFNAREYDRLSKEYNDFKKHISTTIESLELSLDEALKNNSYLKAQLSRLQGNREYHLQTSVQGEVHIVEMQKLKIELYNLKQENKLQNKQFKQLTWQNQSLKSEIERMQHRMTEQTFNFTSLVTEKKILEERYITLQHQYDQRHRTPSRQAQLLRKIATLEQTIVQLEVLIAQLKDEHLLLQNQMQKETRNMFNHYESEMKRVIAQTDGVNSRLVTQVNSLRGQVHNRQSPSKVERQRDDTIRELKRQIDVLVMEKGKLISEKSSFSQEIHIIRQKLHTQSMLVQTLESNPKTGTSNQDYKKKMEELIANLTKERDLIRNQHNSMRLHLQEETKRAIYLESQLMKIQTELQQEKKIVFEQKIYIQQSGERIRILQSSGTNKGTANLDYLNNKIRVLEDALAAVGSQLTDSKTLLASKSQIGPITTIAQSMYVGTGADTVELQRLHQLQQEWGKKERIYLQELELISREIISLKDTMKSGKSNERLVGIVHTQTHRTTGSNHNEGDIYGSRANT